MYQGQVIIIDGHYICPNCQSLVKEITWSGHRVQILICQVCVMPVGIRRMKHHELP